MNRILTLLLVNICFFVTAQELPFGKEIKEFKTQDSIDAPRRKSILFVGSSSFRMWHDVAQDFPGKRIINRGFGGSSLPHVIQYANEIILPYKPKQIVIYCGENDLVSEAVTAQIAADRFKELFNLIRKKMRRVPIVFVSIKPSPSRQHLMAKMAETNALVKKFLDSKRKTTFVNIWDQMLNADGQPRKELFLSDMLHMNAQGYEIWQKALQPVLR
ncbi:MAG: GDSL-type esterase/lipase family protein [Cyclobacteriaceae bacterium]